MCKRRPKPGDRVTVTLGVKEGNKHFNKGRIKSIDGEYFMVMLDYEGGKYAADYPDGILIERYLTEITVHDK